MLDLASGVNTTVKMGFSLDLVDVATNSLISSESFSVTGSGVTAGDALYLFEARDAVRLNVVGVDMGP